MTAPVAPTTPGGYPVIEDVPGFTVSVAVTAGQLVEPDGTTAMVKPATALSKAVLGYALTDAFPDGSTPALTFVQRPSRVAVERNCVAWIRYAADTTFGAKLVCAALGQVTPAGVTPDATTLVGQCYEPGGVLAGVVGRTYIR